MGGKDIKMIGQKRTEGEVEEEGGWEKRKNVVKASRNASVLWNGSQ